MFLCHSGLYFNPLPPCGGRLVKRLKVFEGEEISIHSLRVEGDSFASICRPSLVAFQSTPSVWRETYKQAALLYCQEDFNPLPPCGGRLWYHITWQAFPSLFQSTPSVWRETIVYIKSIIIGNHFNPLPPCGGRQYKAPYYKQAAQFQSTPSVWRETARCWRSRGSGYISIHSLRVEGDH